MSTECADCLCVFVWRPARVCPRADTPRAARRRPPRSPPPHTGRHGGDARRIPRLAARMDAGTAVLRPVQRIPCSVHDLCILRGSV